MSCVTRHSGARKRFVGRLLFLALLVVVLGALLTGCGRGGPTTRQAATTVTSPSTSGPAASSVTTSSVPQVSATTTSAATTTTTVRSTTATTGSGDGLSTAETLLPNGHIKAMGFIKRVWVDGGTRRLEIDYAEMLTGAAADAAALEAGLIGPGEHADNDYFISNVNPALRIFTVSPAAAFFDDTGVTGVPITWETFLGYWTGDPAGAAHKRAAPWWIERDGTTVVKVNQQYLP
jgi:hypothetical protein